MLVLVAVLAVYNITLAGTGLPELMCSHETAQKVSETPPARKGGGLIQKIDD